MGVTLEQAKQHDGLSVIRLQGAIDAGCAVELKRLLVEGLKPDVELRVSLAAAASLDVTTMQLLWAAARQAKATGAAFALEGEIPQPVSLAFDEAGFDEFPIAAEVTV
ncbi:MAG: STAS domain-containing protein [Terracidiphilus sp.]|jgi:anti-anti-sigma regulatory factor